MQGKLVDFKTGANFCFEDRGNSFLINHKFYSLPVTIKKVFEKIFWRKNIFENTGTGILSGEKIFKP